MNKQKPQPVHAEMKQFRQLSGELLVNGISISIVKQIAGQTPFYVYDRSVIASKIQNLRSHLPNKLKLHYAVKANPFPALVSYVGRLVDGLDVASGLELQMALNSGMPVEQISFAGPGKRNKELRMAVASQTTINVESFNELDRIASISNELGIKAKVAIRINPDFELKSSGMKMGGGAQQFGIDAEKVVDTFNKIKEFDLHYRGMHIFTGSQNLNADSICTAHQGIFELATQIQKNCPFNIELLNIGGGLGIPYFPGEKPLDLSPIGTQLESHIEAFRKQFGETEIAMELGRYIVGDCGLYVAEIIDIKESRGTTFAIVDGGLNHHLSASGNFGQVIRKNYPAAIANKMDSPLEKPIQIVGPLCTPLDLLANKLELPAIEIGDLVAIYQSGAYGYTASPRDFLSHPHPVELLI